MDVSCQCKKVSFRTSTPAPLAVYCCHCSECRKQSSSAYGISATFPADAVPATYDAALRESMGVYVRNTKKGYKNDCYFCKYCGSRIFHQKVDQPPGPNGPTVNVKGGLIRDLDMTKAQHIWTKEAVVPLHSGALKWPESPRPSREPSPVP